MENGASTTTLTLDDINAIVQIAFWFVAASIAILTYLQARRTVFQPAKNEVFKAQISRLQEVLSKLNWRNNIEAAEMTGVSGSARITIDNIFVEYAQAALNVTVKRKSEPEKARGMLISGQADFLERIQGPADKQQEEKTEEQNMRDDWNDYELHFIETSEKYIKTSEVLEEYISDPLLPDRIIQLLRRVRDTQHESLLRCKDDIQKIARAFPRHYPDADSLKNIDLTWTHNELTERGDKLFETMKDLRREIREYLQSDRLLKG